MRFDLLTMTAPLSTKPTRFHVWLLLGGLLVCIGGLGALAIHRSREPTPTLDEVRALARAKEFRRAQGLLERYVKAYPSNQRAHLLMAELATEPGNVQPALALAELAKLKPTSTKQAALIKFFEGKARFQEKRYDLTEECWNEALRLDPLVPEAGWALVDLLDRESRTSEGHRLGMRLHEVEPDPRDRVKILLEMIRLDIEVPDPLSQAELFRDLVKAHPEHVPLVLTLAAALVRVNQPDEGLELIKGALKRKPRAPEVWDTWLTALYDASEVEKLASEYGRLPKELSTDPRFAKHEGMIAQIARDWPKAVAAYRRAFEYEPYNWGVCYRLRFALRMAGESGSGEFARIDRLYQDYKAAAKQVKGSFFERFSVGEKNKPPDDDINHDRGAYYETLGIDTLGVAPHPELYQRLAHLREQMGRFDEARAWHRLVLRDSPSNTVSLAALERLK
jgi:tetratricopeptide (TPR) repeat protein